MIPELILNGYYAFDEYFVNESIQKADLSGGVSGRIGGFRYEKKPGGKEILAWQCNLAVTQGFEVKLPTIVHMFVDENNVIQSITLNEQFKGSQGIPCSWKFLNRLLREILLYTDFSLQNKDIVNPKILCCRHTYELVLGACALAARLESENIGDAYLSESTMAYAAEDGGSIESVDRICLNGADAVTRMNLNNFRGSLNYDSSGAVNACDGLTISGNIYGDGKFAPLSWEKTINAVNGNDFKMKMMKAISKFWLDSGKRLGVNKDFYFSHLWPPSLFGLISQALALISFKDNYSYFQHSVSGIQRFDGAPQCIGVIDSVDEGKRLFNGFEETDLY